MSLKRQWRVWPAWRCVEGAPCTDMCDGKGRHGNGSETWSLVVESTNLDTSRVWGALDLHVRRDVSRAILTMDGADVSAYSEAPQFAHGSASDGDMTNTEIVEWLLTEKTKATSVWFHDAPLYRIDSSGLAATGMVGAWRSLIDWRPGLVWTPYQPLMDGLYKRLADHLDSIAADHVAMSPQVALLAQDMRAIIAKVRSLL